MVQFVKFIITPVHHHQSQQDATLDRFIRVATVGQRRRRSILAMMMAASGCC